MKIRAILTDLDGTLLEPDGSICAEALREVRHLTGAGVPVCLVTSKTPTEVIGLLAQLGLDTPAGFENGAGVVFSDGRTIMDPAAVPTADLRRHAENMRVKSGAPLRLLSELADDELHVFTCLRRSELAAVRDRRATLPLLVDARWDRLLRASMPGKPRMRLVRGNRFLHLQGDHDKTSVIQVLLSLLPPREGALVCFGDSPNDFELLTGAEVAVIVPSVSGPNRELMERVPAARVAPCPHGLGWAMAVRHIVERAPSWI